MDRRELLTIVGAGTAGLLATGGAAALAQDRGGQQQQHQHEHHPHHEHLQTLNACESICGRAAHHCLEQLRGGGQDAEAHALAHELAMDCQATCSLATDLTARGSKVAHYVHRACAEVCARCAEACEKAGDDEIMTECARICREAAEACRQMAQQGQGGRSR